jgi:hypothetical protein
MKTRTQTPPETGARRPSRLSVIRTTKAPTAPTKVILRDDHRLVKQYCPAPPSSWRNRALQPGQARLGAQAITGMLQIYQAGRESVFPDIKFAHETGAPIYLITNVGPFTSPPGPLTWLKAKNRREAEQAAEVAKDGTTYSFKLHVAPTRGQGVILNFSYSLHLSSWKKNAGTISMFGHWQQYCVYSTGKPNEVVYVPFGVSIVS